MKIAVMQPYFFPYMGYFQLADSVDIFVFLDDANFIKRGWINRNNLVFNNRQFLFSIPLEHVSQNMPINEVRLAVNNGREFYLWLNKFRHSMEASYKNQKHFADGMNLLEETLAPDTGMIGDLAISSVENTCHCLGIETRFMLSSALDPDRAHKGAERIIYICQQLGADTYINPPGGRGLYTAPVFRKNGISLNFLKPSLKPYQAIKRDFFPNLSILDAIMCQGKQAVREELLPGYEIEGAD